MISAEECAVLLINKGYTVNFEKDQQPYNLNIVGVRNKFGRPNYFDDVILVFYHQKGKLMSHHFQATTLPGIPYLLKPVNPEGAALLVPGQYKDAYQLGKHKGYDALIQVGPVKVYRDNNLDLEYDFSNPHEGFFGINIHRASLTAKVVGPDSAGCQVIKKRSDYEHFISLCKKYKNFHGSKATYTLVEI